LGLAFRAVVLNLGLIKPLGFDGAVSGFDGKKHRQALLTKLTS